MTDTYGVECCAGGATHNESVGNALRYAAERYPNCAKILFADSARPFVTPELIDKFFALLDTRDGVIAAQKITDSIGKIGEQFVDREEYYMIQKPEAFKFAELREIFDAGAAATAIVQQMPPEARIERCYDLKRNIKITYPEDLSCAEALLDMNGEKRGICSYDIRGGAGGGVRSSYAQAGLAQTVPASRLETNRHPHA
jgi:2-C-methyl-D-erythritol 4-phosphate cytidylyltransferase